MHIFIERCNVAANEFVFSNNRNTRIKRHLVFWGTYCVVSFYANIEVQNKNDFFNFDIYKYSFIAVVCFLPSSIFFVYLFIYVLIPRFIKSKKYATFMGVAFIVAILFFIADYFLSYIYFGIIAPGVSKDDLLLPSIQEAYKFGVQNGLALCGCAVGVKLAKEWYLQQKENTMLARRESKNKIKLLKSHLRPGFLFHSLRNLHKKIDQSAGEAPEMVLHLSEIFSYMLYDCEDEKVALNKELSAIQHLTVIEKMNNGNSLKINITVTGNSDDKDIPPLLLFSVLQHLLTDNAKIETDEKCIDINIDIHERVLYADIRLSNSKGDNAITLVHPEVFNNLQQNLPTGYLQYKKENLFITVTIILFRSDVSNILSNKPLAHQEY